MSGLAGLISLDGRMVERQTLDRMASTALYRARDGVGLWHCGEAGLIRFKHATTPQAVHEIQPYENGRSGLVICFDGRLDNRDELLRILAGSAGLDGGAADCVIVLALFKRDGEECVQRLVGDYAFAVWQPENHRLFCARSPLGWRPMQWYRDNHVFAFATDLKTLIDGLRIDRPLNEPAIGEYLAMHFTHPTDTFWKDIHRLEPGGALTIENGRMRLWHWHNGPFPDLSNLPEDELIGQFQSLFDQSLASCMRSTSPVAAHLSGGLDSSSVVCRATELYRMGRIDTLIRPISARYPGEMHDETEWSHAVEEHIGLEALVVTPGRFDWDWARDWCAETYHLPLRPNVLGLLVASAQRARAEGICVILSGEGGDDWLSGSLGHWPDLLRQGRFRQLLRESRNQGAPVSLLRGLYRVIRSGAGPWFFHQQRRQILQPNYDCSYVVPDWLQPQWARQISLAERWQACNPVLRFNSFSQHQRYARYGLARLHVNVENAQAFIESQGVELRHPLHDLRLTTFLMGVPGHMLLRNGQRKYLLREAMRNTLPEKVRTRHGKANFSTAIVEAMLQVLTEHDADKLLCVKMGWVNGKKIWQILDAHRCWAAAKGSVAMPGDTLGAVWSALALDLWLRGVIRM
jgi:asparagine synthase (glutamine-hydrolysing)